MAGADSSRDARREVDEERVRQIQELLARENGQEEVVRRFGPQAQNSEEFKQARARAAAITKRQAQQREQAMSEADREQREQSQRREAERQRQAEEATEAGRNQQDTQERRGGSAQQERGKPTQDSAQGRGQDQGADQRGKPGQSGGAQSKGQSPGQQGQSQQSPEAALANLRKAHQDLRTGRVQGRPRTPDAVREAARVSGQGV